MAKYYEEFIKGTLAILIIGLISKVVAYFTRFLFARNLTLEEFGLFYAVLSLVLFLGAFRTIGLDATTAVFTAKYFAKKDMKKLKGLLKLILGIKTLITIVIAIILVVFAKIIALNFFKTTDAIIPIYFLAGFFLLIGIFDSFRSIFRGLNKNLLFSAFGLVQSVLIIIFAYFFFGKDMGVLVPSISYVIATLLAVIAMVFFLVKFFPNYRKLKPSFPKKEKIKAIRFSATAFMHSVAGLILAQIDILMLTAIATLQVVAYYNAVLPLANVMIFFSGTLSFVLLTLGKKLLSTGKKKELINLVMELKRYTFLLVWLVAVIAAIYSHELLYYLFGAEYTAGANGLFIYILGIVFYAIAILNNQVLYIFEKPGTAARIVLATAIFNILLNLLLIPRFNMVGAIITTVLGFIIMLLLSHKYSEAVLGNKLNFRLFPKMLRIGIVSIIYLVLALYLRSVFPYSIVNAIIVTVLSMLFYAIALITVRAITKKEIKYLVNLIKSATKGGSSE